MLISIWRVLSEPVIYTVLIYNHVHQVVYKVLSTSVHIFMHEHFYVYGTQVNHDTNKVVTDRLINKVKANTPKFSKSDIRGT